MIYKDKGSDGPKCVERDACEVFTKGTLVDPELLGGAGARYMMYLHFDEAHASHGAAVAGAGRGGTNFSACLLDCATSQVYYTILYYTILYYTILYYTIPWYTIMLIILYTYNIA